MRPRKAQEVAGLFQQPETGPAEDRARGIFSSLFLFFPQFHLESSSCHRNFFAKRNPRQGRAPLARFWVGARKATSPAWPHVEGRSTVRLLQRWVAHQGHFDITSFHDFTFPGD